MNKFKVGDEVRIIKAADKRSCYKGLCNHTGVVKYLRTYVEETTYYLELKDRVNPAQEHGWFVYEEQDLEHKCLFRIDELQIVISGTTYNVEDFAAIKNKYEKENKEMNILIGKQNILDLYFDNERQKIIEKYKEKERKIVKKDIIFAQLEAFKVQMKDVKGLKINYDYAFPQEINDKVEQMSVERDREIDVLRDLVHEIEVLYDVCETYEQKQAILKAYGVIDEQGKLIK